MGNVMIIQLGGEEFLFLGTIGSSSWVAHAQMSLKAHTHTPTFAESALESALESADSSSELADFNADTPVGMSSLADCP